MGAVPEGLRADGLVSAGSMARANKIAAGKRIHP
jgi:hypothetical protein